MSSPVIVLQAGSPPGLHYNDERRDRNSTSRRENFISGDFLATCPEGHRWGTDGFYKFYSCINQLVAFEMWWLHGPPFNYFQALPPTSTHARKTPKTPIKIGICASTYRQLRRNYFSRSEPSIAGHWRSKFLSCWRPCLLQTAAPQRPEHVSIPGQHR